MQLFNKIASFRLGRLLIFCDLDVDRTLPLASLKKQRNPLELLTVDYPLQRTALSNAATTARETQKTPKTRAAVLRLDGLSKSGTTPLGRGKDWAIEDFVLHGRGKVRGILHGVAICPDMQTTHGPLEAAEDFRKSFHS
jgi:hypothetical protein